MQESSNHGLIHPSVSIDDLDVVRSDLHDWYRRQMDLSGGWLPQIDEAYTPRLVGLFSFTKDESKQLEAVGRQLGHLYARVGQQIQENDALRTHLLGRLSISEQGSLKDCHRSTIWASTLRADAVFDENNRLRILEVNTDNVAGLEDVLIQLEFWRHRGAGSHNQKIQHQREHLVNSIQRHIDCHWNLFRSSPGFCGRDIDRPTICVSFQDREDSFFMARYFGAVLRDLGYEVTVQRPEHIHLGNDGLLGAEQVGGTQLTVDLVMRHWLSFEMYMAKGGELDPKFKCLFQAAEEGRALILSPFNDRLLFSKEIQAMLTNSSNNGGTNAFQLTLDEAAFCRKHLVASEVVELAAPGYVIKAANSYGGKDVIMGDGSHIPWVRQPYVNGLRSVARYCSPTTGEWAERELHVVHGLLVHRISPDKYELTGLFTRLGPDPIVNWIRGAQFVPGLLCNYVE